MPGPKMFPNPNNVSPLVIVLGARISREDVGIGGLLPIVWRDLDFRAHSLSPTHNDHDDDNLIIAIIIGRKGTWIILYLRRIIGRQKRTQNGEIPAVFSWDLRFSRGSQHKILSLLGANSPYISVNISQIGVSDLESLLKSSKSLTKVKHCQLCGGRAPLTTRTNSSLGWV